MQTLRMARSLGTLALGFCFMFPGISPAAEPATTPSPPPRSPSLLPGTLHRSSRKNEECHHKGTAAPFSVATYEDVRPRARSIKAQVLNRNMPPWSIDKSVGIRHFVNDRSLNDSQIAPSSAGLMPDRRSAMLRIFRNQRSGMTVFTGIPKTGRPPHLRSFGSRLLHARRGPGRVVQTHVRATDHGTKLGSRR